MEWEQDTGNVGDAPVTGEMSEYRDIVDSNRIVCDTPAAEVVLVATDIIDSECMRIVGDTPATWVNPGDINDVGSFCTHICVKDNFNVHVDSWITRVCVC